MSKPEIVFLKYKPSTSTSLGRSDFLLALIILILNDLLLKDLFHNWLTGKLSDFAGIYAVFIFIKSLSNGRINEVWLKLILTASFIFWKSELSQGLLNVWNSLALFELHRVVDYSDLLALSMIYLQWIWPIRRTFVLQINRTALIAVSVFVFIATSVPAKRVFIIDQDSEAFEFKMPVDTLVMYLQSMDREQDILYEPFDFRRTEPTSSYYDLVDSLAKYELIYDTLLDRYRIFPHGIFKIEDQQNHSAIVLQKTFWMDVYNKDYSDKLKKKSLRSFERGLIKKIRKKEKSYLKNSEH